MPQVRGKETERAEIPRANRGYRPADSDFLGHGATVHWPCAAEGKKREGSRVLTAFDRHFTDRPAHVGLDDAQYALGDEIEVGPSQLPRHPGDRRLGEIAPQPHEAAEARVGMHAIEDDIGIGHRRLFSAGGIAGRPRHRTGAARTHGEPAVPFDIGDAATAGANGVDVELDLRGSPLTIRCDAALGLPSFTRQTSVLVPPMS